MTRTSLERSRYPELRKGRRTLAVLAPLVQVGFLTLGLAIFLEQSRSLLSDAQFTWGERQVLGLVALLALGGCGFAGWIAGRLIKIAAEIVDVLADGAEAARRTNELLEQHVIPALVRASRALEVKESPRERSSYEERS
jgi:hypothetical protein